MRRLSHLLALNAFTLLQPALDQLSGNPEYLILEDYSLFEVLTVVLLLACTLPCLQLAAVIVLERCGKTRAAKRLMNIWLGLGGALCGVVLSRWLASIPQVQEIGVPQSILVVLAIPAAAALPWLCQRSELFQQVLAVCSIGTLLFPLSLLTVPAARYQLLGQPISAKAQPGHIGNPVPVVMVVFDGLNGMSLLDADRQINRDWFPGFARLAATSTFYRNATTVHTRTDHAVPAILASALPEELQRPVEADYPGGLLRLIFDSRQYEMVVFEPLTRMSPTELRQIAHQRSPTAQITRLLGTLLRVYIRISLPQELPFLPAIPREWFGLLPTTATAQKPMKGQIIYGWDEHRSVQADHFVSNLRTAGRPGFHFLHIALPHYPWSLLPSGQPYVVNGTIGSSIYGLDGETWAEDPWPVKQAWHRNLLQIQCADRLVSRILDALTETQQLQESLVVITADHGMCFSPGRNLRDPTTETLADLLPVPLFIKLPGQTTGSASDRSAETIDILPTIAEVLQMSADPRWEGSSLLSTAPRPRKTVRGAFNTILAPDFPSRFDHTDRLLAAHDWVCEAGRIRGPQAVPELVGRRVSEFSVEESTEGLECIAVPGTIAAELRPPPVIPGEPFAPCLIHGRLLGPSPQQPAWLAIAAGGRILATTRPSVDGKFEQTWSAWIEPELLPTAAIPLEVYRVDNPETPQTLMKLPIRKGENVIREWESDWIFRSD